MGACDPPHASASAAVMDPPIRPAASVDKGTMTQQHTHAVAIAHAHSIVQGAVAAAVGQVSQPAAISGKNSGT